MMFTNIDRYMIARMYSNIIVEMTLNHAVTLHVIEVAATGNTKPFEHQKALQEVRQANEDFLNRLNEWHNFGKPYGQKEEEGDESTEDG